jgi:glycosyltransferase involved in cell wall biosynthesis
MTATVPVTAIVAARNEEKNISRCLRSLTPAQAIYVIDSGSHDATATMAASLGAKVLQFHYQGSYPKKRQWALDTLRITTPWVMLLDADEAIPDALWEEIAAGIQSDSRDAFLATKGFHFLGRPFRFGGFSHTAVILFRRGRARFEQLLVNPPRSQDMEVHERLIIDGRIGRLRTPLIHEDFKGLEAYIQRHNLYSTWEALLRQQYFSTGTWGPQTVKACLLGNSQERRRWLKSLALRLPFEPLFWFFYHYFLCLGFLEGRPGLIASRLRANYIADVRAKLYELTRSNPAPQTAATEVPPL